MLSMRLGLFLKLWHSFNDYSSEDGRWTEGAGSWWTDAGSMADSQWTDDVIDGRIAHRGQTDGASMIEAQQTDERWTRTGGGQMVDGRWTDGGCNRADRQRPNARVLACDLYHASVGTLN